MDHETFYRGEARYTLLGIGETPRRKPNFDDSSESEVESLDFKLTIGDFEQGLTE